MWRRFRFSTYLPRVPPALRAALELLPYNLVAKPSNDASYGLQAGVRRRGIHLNQGMRTDVPYAGR